MGRGILDDFLAKWRAHADTPSGLFNPYLDRKWQHFGNEPRTLVSQCRLIYNFARAFQRSGDQAYADLTQRGLEALLRSFRAAGEEGWVWSCRADGTLFVDTYDAYGHAFVILALATAAESLGDLRYRDLAMSTWAFMQRRLRDQHGGLIWHLSPRGMALDDLRSQNPMMHTFEALLALAPMDDSGGVKEDVRGIWRFLESRMPSVGCLPEWYDVNWQPVRTGQHAYVEVGHVFEWAFLLSYGTQVGYDEGEGGIYSRVDYDGRLIEQRKGWWEQCEAIRAMQRYVVRHGAMDFAGPLRQSLAFVREKYVDQEYGGWYERPPGTGGGPSLLKGNAYKLDYHVVNMCRELLVD